MQTHPCKICIFVLLIIAWYGLGAAYVESFVNYPSWALIHEKGFTDYHQFLAKRITLVLVVPLLLKLALTLFLWYRVKAYRPTLSVVILLQSVFWISSAFIQIPLQSELGTLGKNLQEIHFLITSDLWLRTLPHTLEILLLSYWGYGWLTSLDSP